MIARDIESQSTAGSAVITTTTVTADTSELSSTTGLLARQPPIGIETAAATNPTQVWLTQTRIPGHS